MFFTALRTRERQLEHGVRLREEGLARLSLLAGAGNLLLVELGRGLFVLDHLLAHQVSLYARSLIVQEA